MREGDIILKIGLFETAVMKLGFDSQYVYWRMPFQCRNLDSVDEENN